MLGPYAWEPPTYWQKNQLQDWTLGQAYGFATEIAPSMVPLSAQAMSRIVPEEYQTDDLTSNEYLLYHTGQPAGDHHTFSYFNEPLKARYGDFDGYDQFLKKSDLAVYEAHRAMFEAYN